MPPTRQTFSEVFPALHIEYGPEALSTITPVHGPAAIRKIQQQIAFPPEVDLVKLKINFSKSSAVDATSLFFRRDSTGVERQLTLLH